MHDSSKEIPGSAIISTMQLRLSEAQAELRLEHERLRATQQELRASRERYADLFDHAPVGYVTGDHSGRIREINSTGAAMLGYTQFALRNQLFRAHVAAGHAPAYEEHLGACAKLHDRIVETELYLRRRNGTTFPVRLITKLASSPEDVHPELRTTIVDHTKLKEAQNALRASKDELEQHVFERTAELMKANLELEAQMAARSRLEAELLKVSEREKRNFGQDLHDETCQSLAGLSLFTRVIARDVDGASPAVREKLAMLEEQLRSLVEQTRRIASGLHPVAISGGIVPVLADLATRVNLRVPCKLKVDEAISLAEDEALAFYRIAQEAANNALRHAQASRIEISLRSLKSGVALTVKDDGVGMDMQTVRPGAMGLDIMSCRARSIGAQLRVQAARDRGTKITCLLSANSHGIAART